MQSRQSASFSSPTVLYLAVILILAFWMTRTVAIAQFPPFIDEIFHINFSADVLKHGPLAHAEEGRQFTDWWYILFGAQVNAPIATARLATALIVTLGASAMMAVGRQLAGIWGMLIVGSFYTVSTYHTFFERMARHSLTQFPPPVWR